MSTLASQDDWDRHWDEFSAANTLNPAQRYRHLLAMQLLERRSVPERLLDIGSGQGDFLLTAQGRWPSAALLGLEISTLGVRATRARVPAARAERRDLLDGGHAQPELRGWATHALCSEVLEHVDDPVALLRGAREYLAPGCRLVVTVPGGEMSAFDRHIGHRRHYTPELLRRTLEEAGLDVALTSGAGFPFFNLYRRLVIARGESLVDDAVAEEGGPSRLVVAGMLAFRLLFALNFPRTRWGAQIVAVSSEPGARDGSPRARRRRRGGIHRGVVATRVNARPAARFVHPWATGDVDEAEDHGINLDVAADAAPNHLQGVADLVSPHLGKRVLDMGAGIGAITERLAEGRRLVACEISDEFVAALRQRFDGVGNVEVVQADLRTWQPAERFDSVVMINVLEHIEDDAGTLRALSRFAAPGGTVVIYVPALNGLFGDFDSKVGHFRRYSKWRLGEVMREAGLEVEELRYANMIAIPGWIAFTHASRDMSGGTSLPLWDRYVLPLSQALESRVRVPLGTNLLGVARVPASAAGRCHNGPG